MLRLYFNKRFKYTNREIIALSESEPYIESDYENIDSPDSIHGHIIYVMGTDLSVPSYIIDQESGRRFFVSGITPLRSGKVQLSLLRDVASEMVDLWKKEEGFVSAGLARDYCRYKTWGLPFTNTKVREQRLDFGGKSSFFVFYVNESEVTDGVYSEKDFSFKLGSGDGSQTATIEVDSLSQIPSYEYVNRDGYAAGDLVYWSASRGSFDCTDGFKISGSNNYGQDWPQTKSLLTFDSSQAGLDVTYGNPDYKPMIQLTSADNVLRLGIMPRDIAVNKQDVETEMRRVIKLLTESMEEVYSAGKTQISIEVKRGLDSYTDRYILDRSTQAIYVIRRNEQSVTYSDRISSAEYYPALPGSLAQVSTFPWRNNYYASYDPATDPPEDVCQAYGDYYTFNSTAIVASYSLEKIGDLQRTSVDFKFSSGTRKLPLSAVRCVNIVPDERIGKTEMSQILMQAQANITIGDNVGRIVDVQYLPFSIATEENEDFMFGDVPALAELVENDEWIFSVDMDDLTGINKETDTIKIVSPSRASQFLFRPFNNDGAMKFSIQATIKPFSSVIYVRPSTNGLLLQDFDDKDCLVISEDFSLTAVTSAWTEYVYQNRTWQNSFDRTIQGREFERTWERRIEQEQAKTDIWTARNISASRASAVTGGLPLVSSIASAAATAFPNQDYMNAAAMDRQYAEALYQESVAISRDQFQMQIENIKAQPLVPSRVTTLDGKYLDGVYLEYYSTNPTELLAIENFYRYNGHRIDTYGVFETYWGWFVRGKIIRSIYMTQPELNELNRRLELGLFTGGEFRW